MRFNVVLVGAVVAISAAGAAVAQSAPDRSAKDIVCALSGDCGGAQLDSSQQLDKPSEAAFSFRATGAGATGTAVKNAGAAKAAPVRTASASYQPASIRRSKPSAPVSSLDMRITFANGSADMTDRGRINAQEFARALASPQLQGRRFAVEGHTDAVGARDYNMKLSQDRADAVTAYLKSLGISADRIESKGYGFDRPLPALPAKASANRRVEIVPLG
jgi:outer membrane protein OmpA-like peptidoglycan-associated protein